MNRLSLSVAVALAAVATVAASPYAPLIDRDIKALSRERLESLKTGQGAGYALAAELNGYPGPRHVLDLAGELALTPEQTEATRALFNRMSAEVVPLGTRLIVEEAALDSLFADKRADEDSLLRMTSAIGATEASLRAAHLRYHVAMFDLLTPRQRAGYDRLRGYVQGAHQPEGGHGGH